LTVKVFQFEKLRFGLLNSFCSLFLIFLIGFMFHILHNKPQTPVACHYLLHLFPLRRISAYGNCNESHIVTTLVGKLEKLSEPGLTMKCGAENSTARVAIIVNKVKIIRHKRSTTMAANFQSRVMSLVSSSFFS